MFSFGIIKCGNVRKIYKLYGLSDSSCKLLKSRSFKVFSNFFHILRFWIRKLLYIYIYVHRLQIFKFAIQFEQPIYRLIFYELDGLSKSD